jgi:hypothetical protein
MNPIHPLLSLRSILILSIHLGLGLPSGLFPSDFPTNILYAFLFVQFMIHALPISSSFYLYLKKSTSYEAPHYAVFLQHPLTSSPFTPKIIGNNYNRSNPDSGGN